MNPNAPQNPQNRSQYQPSQPPGNEPQPVAYDHQGRPLYAQPPAPQIVQVSRSMAPQDVPIPPEIMRKHEESVRKYPNLNLSPGEYVISAVKRHPIGIFKIWAIAGILMAALAALILMFLQQQESGTGLFASAAAGETSPAAAVAFGIMGILFVMVMAGAFVATYVYNNNRFYLTNESVIQEIQTSLFSKHEQTVNLSNIEDASFRQDGIIPHIFDYGQIRLSTEGDETTYRFTYVSDPKSHIAILNNAVEAFKNGRPVVLPTADQPS
ncbi:MAG TPA: PH domain-containing protein [Candidatus Saccharimonadales bacterium]|nr:PH domain-containing protein [Candidatus Saccharimonadales bacterium]